MRNIIIMGPPGSGKDTQIDILKDELNFISISAGDIARDLASKDPDLAEIVNSGRLINDDLILAEVDNILDATSDDQGVIFDGFPRTLYQAEKLNEILIKYRRTMDAAVYIEVSEGEIVNRLSKRRVCSVCGANNPENAEKCIKCGGKIVRRADDVPATIINRIGTFLDKTMPLVSYYKDRGILLQINGEQNVRKVHDDIVERLGLGERIGKI